ncbi:hypothetical protein [Moorella sulfitireducens (nom. illeg.)]|uniref:hypothetical protein n=1 Tax=Neomoorella sulfitireducens TaxID=2972948 RepID=UPI0021AD176B|nr:hypothetical protein [Moorella sulfitireducens]
MLRLTPASSTFRYPPARMALQVCPGINGEPAGPGACLCTVPLSLPLILLNNPDSCDPGKITSFP